MIRLLLICWIVTRNTLTQTVTWTVGTSVPRFFNQLKLDCTVSSDCCTSFDRVWENGTGLEIVNNGVSTFPNKFEEDWDGGTTGFSLIIKDLQLGDVGKDYNCQYRIGNDKHTLTQDATWEYQPREKCTVKAEPGSEDSTCILTGLLHIARSAPYPSIFATYGGENVTADLNVTGLTKFDNWFYSVTVSINKEVNCVMGDRFTLIVVTGTSTKRICDEFDICKCLECFGKCFLYSLILQFADYAILIVVLFIRKQITCNKGCIVTTVCNCLLRMGLVYLFLTTFINVVPTLSIGLAVCPCKENSFFYASICWSCATGHFTTFLVFYPRADWTYIRKKSLIWKIFMFLAGFVTGGLAVLAYSACHPEVFKKYTTKADKGKPVELKCPFKAVGKARENITWSKIDDEAERSLQQLGSRFTITEENNLIISAVSEEDAGTYECALSDTSLRQQLNVIR